MIVDGGGRPIGLPDVGTSTFEDTGVPSSGTGTTGSSTGTGGSACPSSCTTDSECQATCPASPGALNCCDAVTMACFTSASTVCPDMQGTGSSSGTGGGY